MHGTDEDEDGAEAEAEVFRRAMRDVRPLKAARRVENRLRPARPLARFARAERRAVLIESLLAPGPFVEAQPGDELIFRRPGVSNEILRQLRRGAYSVEAELDLHGFTGAQGAAQLAQFLLRARGRGLQCVRVIHGKGLRSGQRGPVLKNTVNALLRRADVVLAFASARPAAGGTGATLVLLRREAGARS
ncbi:MAG TPA: Smr/MutS family protein [Steroidobacteraceae bacterium]